MVRSIGITSILVLIGGCASPSIIPEQINPGAKEAMTLIVPAKGVQIYECRASKERQAHTSGRSSRLKPSSSIRPAAASAGTTAARTGKPPRQQGSGQGRGTRDAPRAGDIPWLLWPRNRSARKARSARSRASSASTRWRRGAQGRLLAGKRRHAGAHPVHRGLLLLHRQVGMISRQWRGLARPSRAGDYVEHLRKKTSRNSQDRGICRRCDPQAPRRSGVEFHRDALDVDSRDREIRRQEFRHRGGTRRRAGHDDRVR